MTSVPSAEKKVFWLKKNFLYRNMKHFRTSDLSPTLWAIIMMYYITGSKNVTEMSLFAVIIPHVWMEPLPGAY